MQWTANAPVVPARGHCGSRHIHRPSRPPALSLYSCPVASRIPFARPGRTPRIKIPLYRGPTAASRAEPGTHLYSSPTKEMNGTAKQTSSTEPGLPNKMQKSPSWSRRARSHGLPCFHGPPFPAPSREDATVSSRLLFSSSANPSVASIRRPQGLKKAMRGVGCLTGKTVPRQGRMTKARRCKEHRQLRHVAKPDGAVANEGTQSVQTSRPSQRRAS